MWDERLKKVYKFAKDFMEINTNNPYHNFKHAKEVASFVKILVESEKVSNHEKFLLVTAAYLHDIVFVPRNKNNEEESAKVAGEFLSKIGYSFKETSIVKDLILATKISTPPKNKLEMILCDADIENLGSDKFFDKEKYVMEEFGQEHGPEWDQIQLDFLEASKYYTKTAQKLRAEGLKKNIEKIKERMAKI